METYYWTRNCPRCGQGRLLIMKDRSRGALYLHCEECEWGWRNPADAAAGVVEKAFLTLTEEFESSVASLQEIEAQGWSSYVTGEFQE